MRYKTILELLTDCSILLFPMERDAGFRNKGLHQYTIDVEKGTVEVNTSFGPLSYTFKTLQEASDKGHLEGIPDSTAKIKDLL